MVACSGILPLYLLHDVDYFLNDFFSLTDHKCVNESMHRFRIKAGVTAGDDEGICGSAIGGAERNPSQVEHVESIGVEGLIRKGETQDVKSCQGMPGLKRVERDAARAHQIFHVHPGSVGAFG